MNRRLATFQCASPFALGHVRVLVLVLFPVLAAMVAGCGIRRYDSRVTITVEPTTKPPGGGDVGPTVAPQLFPTTAPGSYLSCTGLSQDDAIDESIEALEVQDLCNTLSLLGFSQNLANETDDPLDF